MIEWLFPVAAVWALQRTGWLDLDWRLRNTFRWRRGAPALPHAPKDGLFGPEAAPEAARLIQTYGLEAWAEAAGREALATSLFYVQLVERALREAGVELPDPLAAVDVGTSDWFYVRGLHAVLAHGGRHVTLDGLEVDPWRVYRDGYSRLDHALAHIGPLAGVNFLPGDACSYDRPVTLAFMFYPFLFRPDLVGWGLPRRMLRPASLLAHVAGRLVPGGWLIVTNLSEAEREAQHRLLEEAGLEIVWWAEHASALWQYDSPRFVTVARQVSPTGPG